MKTTLLLTIFCALLPALATARSHSARSHDLEKRSSSRLQSMPSNLKALFNKAKKSGCNGGTQLDTQSGGFHASGRKGTHYCAKSKKNPKAIWVMANMDVDCDGSRKKGPCGNDPTHNGETAFTNHGHYIDAQQIPYVVLNEQHSFSAHHFGLNGLNPVAVVCNGKLTWAVFGDTNNTGEGSLQLARTCFGNKMTGDNGHDQGDVLYVAFPKVTVKDASNYGALKALGDSLLKHL